MKRGDSSPWDRPRIPDGPRTVGDDSADTGEDERPPRGVHLPVDYESTDVRIPPTPPTPPPTESGPARDVPWKKIGAIAAAVTAVIAVAAVAVFAVSTLADRPSGFDSEDAARSVVRVIAPDCEWAGSGSLVTSSGLVLTNSHVATDGGKDVCSLQVGFIDSYDEEPSDWYRAVVVVDDMALDISVIQVLNKSGDPLQINDRDAIPLNTDTPELGDEIQTLGYPSIGGATLTFTSGDFAGVDGSAGTDFYKTTASLNPGVSGGSAFNGTFELVGIPTAGIGVEIVCEQADCSAFGDSLGLIRPIRYAISLIEEAERLTR